GKVAVLRRDQLWADSGKPAFAFRMREEFTADAPAILTETQSGLLAEARERRDANITRGVTTMDALTAFYTDDQRYPGWVEVQWSKPTGDALAKVVEQLKALKLTIRNVPIGAEAVDGACIFTGEPAVE